MNPPDPMTLPPESDGDEQQLREALRPFRADPEAFADAIDRKLREAADRDNADGSADDGAVEASPFLRAAASLMPLVVKSESIRTGGGMTKFGWHSIAPLLALPVVSVIMMLASFFFALRRIGNAQFTETADAPDVEASCREWWRKYRWPVAVLVALLFALFLTKSTLALSIVIASSMVAFGALISILARYGIASRGRTAACCFYWFFFFAQFSQSVHLWLPGEEGFLLSPSWIPFLLCIGAALCASFMTINNRTLRVSKWLMVGLALLMGWLTGGRVLFPASVDITELSERCSEFKYGHSHHVRWNEWGPVAEWVRRNNGSFDPTQARTYLKAAIDARERRLPVYPLGAATRLQILTHKELIRLLDDDDAAYSRKKLLESQDPPRPIGSLPQREWLIRALVQTDLLTEAQTDTIEDKLLATWPTETRHACLEEMAMIDSLLSAIGRDLNPDVVAKGVAVRLTDLWVSDAPIFSPAGGFAGGPELTDHSNVVPTLAAIRLMARFGVPQEIRLRQLRSYLISEATPQVFGSRRWDHLVASVTLDRLDRDVGYPRLSVWQALVSERMIIGVVMMIVLALFAIVRARPD